MEHERLHASSLSTPDQALAVMRYLSEQCSTRPLVHTLVESDVRRWSRMKPRERQIAFERAVRRVSVVCPWVLDKGRVRDTAEAFGKAPAETGPVNSIEAGVRWTPADDSSTRSSSFRSR